MRVSHGFYTIGICVILMCCPRAWATDEDQEAIEQSVRLLSHYPAGTLPVDPTVMLALHTLQRHANSSEISLLRQLAQTESNDIRAAARDAMTAIRSRQRAQRRVEFGNRLSDSSAVQGLHRQGHSQHARPEETACVEYAAHVIGSWSPKQSISPKKGHAQTLLADGRLRDALAAVLARPGHDARMLEATILEDLGETHSAVRLYALEFGAGYADARVALEGFGVDPERLLLGLLGTLETPQLIRIEAEMLDTLVRQGNALTVSVLVERMEKHPTFSERATATDALARMLDPAIRKEPLSTTGTKRVKQALYRVSGQDFEPTRSIALEALNAYP